MSNLKLLVKVGFQNTFELNNFFNKRVKKSSKSNFAAGSSLIMAMIVIAAMVAVYFWGMATGLKAMGMLDMLIVMTSVVCFMVSFFTSIFKAQGILFAAKDFEALMSLPIKPQTILASKVIELLILNYMFVGMVIIPASIVYYFFASVSPVFFLFAFIGLIVIPLFPVVLASILAFGLSYVSSKFKAKNTVMIVASLALVVLLVFGSFKMNDIINFVLAKSDSIYNGIKTICPPAYHFANGLTNLDVSSMGILILWSVIPFIVFTIVFGRAFKAINLRLGETYKKSNYKMKSLKTSTKIGALLKREAKAYFSSSIYLMNTSIGIILVTVAAIGSIFIGAEGVVKVMAQGNTANIEMMMPQLLSMLQFIPLGIFIFCVSLTCTTGCSISLEGKNLWIIKSLPIAPMDIFKSKIALNLLISIPAIIIDVVLFGVAFKLTAINFFFTLVISLLLAVLVAIAGIIINLYFPKLKWKNQTQVVKQSLSSMLSMFFGMIVIAIGAGLSFLVYKVFKIADIYVYFWGITIYLGILVVTSIVILKLRGEELFNKLNS